MKLKHLFLALVAGLVALVSCEQPEKDLSFPAIEIDKTAASVEMASSSFPVTITSNRAWRATSDAAWIAIDPDSGEGSEEPQTVNVTVLENKSYNRTAKVTFDIIYDTMVLTVDQAGNGSPEDYIIYSNDFDKEVATQAYGSSGTSWPYLDQFEGWKNEIGVGTKTLEYAFSGMSARNNSNSNGSYSDYAGSGANNLLFGTNGYIAIKNMSLNGFKNLKLSFGTEMYDNNNKTALFDPAQFLVYASIDGKLWTPVAYEYKGTAAGRWNIAEAAFSVPEGTASIGLYIKATVASCYRLDDLKLEVAEEECPAMDFSQGTEIEIGGGSGTGGGTGDDIIAGDLLYKNTFDKQTATQTYGTQGKSWPYLDQFEGWKCESGSGAAGVRYLFGGVSVRANSQSNADFSDYSGSGANNIFFGTDGFFCVKDIALSGNTKLCVAFGTEKYDGNNKTALFDPTECLVYVSADGAKWVKLPYTYQGTAAGRWNIALGTFSIPAGTAKLSICVKTSVASVYRMDDLTLSVAETADTAIDFTNGIDLGLGGTSTGGGTDDGGGSPGNVKFSKLDPSNVKEGTYVIAYTTGGKTYLMKNEVKSSYYVGSGTFDLSKGTAPAEDYRFTIKSSNGGYTIQNSKGGYVGIEISGTHYNLKPAMTSAFIWNFSAGTGDAVVAKGGSSTGDYCISYNAKYDEFTVFNNPDTCPIFYCIDGAQDDSGSGSGDDSGTGGDDSGETGGTGSNDGSTITWTVGANNQKWNETSDATLGAGFTATDAGMTVSYFKSSSTTAPITAKDDHIRVYKGSTMVITVDGANITGVEFSCTESKYCVDMPVSDGSTAKSDTGNLKISWSGNTAKFQADATNGQLRITGIKVTYKK